MKDAHILHQSTSMEHLALAPESGSDFLLMQIRGSSSNSTSDWVPATHTGGLHCVPGSWFPVQSQPLQAFGKSRGELCLSLPLSPSKIN